MSAVGSEGSGDISIPELNEAFYDGTPDEYFLQRLFNLMLIVGGGERLDEIVESGITYRSLRLIPPTAAEVSEEEANATLERFAALEAEFLFHHVSEVLLRLHLAHVEAPPCPWITLTSMTNFRLFKRRVAQDIVDAPFETLAQRVSSTFFGGDSPRAVGIDMPANAWEEAVAGITKLVQTCGRHILQRGNLYNAAKHGFGLTAGAAEFSVEQDNDEVVTLAKGPAIEYLERRAGGKKDVQHWCRTVSWISIERTIALTYLTCYALQSLWSVARCRYTDTQTLKLVTMPSTILDDILSKHDNILYDLRQEFLVVMQR